MQHPPVMPSHGYVAPVYPPWAINASMHQQQQQQEGEAGGEAEEESQYAGEVEESPPSYVLSEEAIALFAQGEERRRRDRTRRRKQAQAAGRKETRKDRPARKKSGTFVTLKTMAAAGNAPDMSERLARASMFGDDGLAKIEELEGMMNTLYTRACDTKQPTVWPSMPLRLGS